MAFSLFGLTTIANAPHARYVQMQILHYLFPRNLALRCCAIMFCRVGLRNYENNNTIYRAP